VTTALAGCPRTEDVLEAFRNGQRQAGVTPWGSMMTAAATFLERVDRAGGWTAMDADAQRNAVDGARRFASWLMVTGRLVVDADLLTSLDLRLGVAAKRYLSDAHARFVALGGQLGTRPFDIALQWNALMKVAVVTGSGVEAVGEDDFERARGSILDAYQRRGTPAAGRNMASIFHRLRVTLFHAGRLSSHRRPETRTPVAVSGWSSVPPRLAETAHRYIEQVTLSLRPNTVSRIEHDLREFGTWLAATYPHVETCKDLERCHIEAYKTWLVTTPRARCGGRPLNRISVKNALINLHCFFDRVNEWGYPEAPQRPLIFIGDLPIIDKPLPRFLDDGAAAKLLRAARADPDPLSRLIVELLARTGIRKGELLALTVDGIVQIGSAFWLRVPIGKLHNDRYIPLHPQLKELLDDWIAARPAGLRTDRLLVERSRPVTAHRVDHTLRRSAAAAGIGHVTAHQLRHTLATQAINRGMSLDAIAALLGHKTLAMTMVYARIADKTVAEEYFAVTEKVEALYDQPHQLADTDEGNEMRRLRSEMHRRMLGNGYCARPVEMDCHFESICESCTFFVTTIEFRPNIQRQRDDAANKGQVGRQKVFDGLLTRLDSDAS
jgi:integrase/recombinase XerD